MKKYKAIVCDIDGTILDVNHQIPDELTNLFTQLQSDGVIVTLASARPTLSILEVGNQLNLQAPLIALNGSLMVNSQAEIIYNQQFEFKRIQAVLETFPDILVNSYNGAKWYANQHNENILREENFVKFKAQIGLAFPELSNMVVLIAEHTKLLAVQQHILNYEPDLSAVFSHPEYLHVAVHGVCKASGVAQFAHMHQLELSDFIAFGDGENDISMLQQVGHGVAMGNASARVKQAVTRVTSSNQELGVVRYLENLLKLGLIG